MRTKTWLGRTLVFSASMALAIAAVPAQAQNVVDPGWYFGIEGGFNSLSDATNHATSSQPGAPTPGTLQLIGLLVPELSAVDAGLSSVLCPILGTTACPPGSSTVVNKSSQTVGFKGGTGFGLGIGFQSASGLRPELNLDYRSNDFKSSVNDLTTTTTSGGTSTTQNSHVVATSVTGKATAYSAMGNLWFDFAPTGNISPYLGGGLGASRVAYKNFSTTSSAGTTKSLDRNSTVFSWQAGAGVNFKLSEHLRASLDYRYLVANKVSFDIDPKTTLETDYKAQSVMLGLHYAFGSWSGTNPKCPNAPKGVALGTDGCPLDSDGDGVPDYQDKCPGTPPGVKVDANGCELDSDGDGVPDSRDQCPGTPKGVAVDTNGCPLDSDGDGVPDYLDKCPNTPKGVLVDANGCPAQDSDGDGVPDYLDKCPNTPKGIAVDANGCPLDSDGDGIPDYLDECPHTPAGAKILPNGCAPVGDCRKPRPGEEVDANGCALEKTFILRGVKFEFDSDRLTEDAKRILDGVASTLNNYPEISVELGGHTDNIGTDAYNLGLSERRSISVKNYLTGKSVGAARMLPVGYGETQPIQTNDTEEGREENRRVELKVLESTQ